MRFVKETRAVVKQAEAEARAAGARKVEAEHLLLALGTLRHVEPTRDELAAVLRDHERECLEAVGVRLEDFDAIPVHPTRGPLDIATSAKRTLERAMAVAAERRDRHVGAEHVALALQLVHAATPARALRHADIEL